MLGRELLSEIALVFATRGDFDGQMDAAIAAAGSRLGLSRSRLFLDSADGTATTNTHEWCAPGVPSQKDSLKDIPYSEIPSRRRLLESEGLISAEDAAKPPPDLRAVPEPQGVRSRLAFPLRMEGELRRFVGFDECGKPRTWSAGRSRS